MCHRLRGAAAQHKLTDPAAGGRHFGLEALANHTGPESRFRDRDVPHGLEFRLQLPVGGHCVPGPAAGVHGAPSAPGARPVG